MEVNVVSGAMLDAAIAVASSLAMHIDRHRSPANTGDERPSLGSATACTGTGRACTTIARRTIEVLKPKV
jgi:hypothetical protein